MPLLASGRPPNFPLLLLQLQVHTPPDSNKSVTNGESEGGGAGRLGGGLGGGRVGAVRPEELCKMFPTPPSLEPSLQASPSAFSLPEPEHATLTRCGSPPDEPIVVSTSLHLT